MKRISKQILLIIARTRKYNLIAFLHRSINELLRCDQGRSQVFIGGGARWGNIKFIHKTLLQNNNPEKFLL